MKDLEEVAVFIADIEDDDTMIESIFLYFETVYPGRINAVSITKEECATWTRYLLKMLRTAMLEDSTEELTYVRYHGAVIANVSPIFNSLFNFMETFYSTSRFIIAAIWQRFCYDPTRAKRLMDAFEAFVLGFLKSNLEGFLHEGLVPGCLTGDPALVIGWKDRQLPRNGEQISKPPADASQEQEIPAHQTASVPEAPNPLTKREREILQLIAEGKSNKEIAALLGIGLSTVKNYVSTMLGKLYLGNRTELAVFALQQNSTKVL